MTSVAPAPADQVPYDELITPELTVLVIGAGFSGLAAGNRLRKNGIVNFLILDKGAGVGGTWRQNTYPGIEVDIPSMSYSYPEAPNPRWSKIYAPGAELRKYAEDCADKFRVSDKLRLNTEVREVIFDEINDLWRVRAVDRHGEFEITTRFIISCHGALSTPAKPDIPGLENFAGKTILSQEWDHGYSLKDKRVAVIGTGASGIQIIPAIAPQVQRLTVFQRTPIYVLPKINVAVPRVLQLMLAWIPLLLRGIQFLGWLGGDVGQTLAVVRYKQFPFLIKFGEIGVKLDMRRRIKDRELRKKLIPSYGFVCKRPSFSSNYLETYRRANVDLVAEPISRVVPQGVETADGVVHEIDTLVLATGFKVFDLPYRVVGMDGVDLGEHWEATRMRAYHGASVPGFPNYFMAPGPYGVVGFNWFDTVAMCTKHATDMIAEALARSATRVEISRAEFERFFDEVSELSENLVFKSPACAHSNSYYIDKNGDSPYLRPYSILHSNAIMRRAPQAYVQSRRSPDVPGRMRL